MIVEDANNKPKVRKRAPGHALTKKHKNKKKYNRKNKRKKETIDE